MKRSLDEIRDSILARIEEARDRRDAAEVDLNIAESELIAHDRAVAAMPGLPNAPAPTREKRRDLRALVLAYIRSLPLAAEITIERLAEVIGRARPKQLMAPILAALAEGLIDEERPGLWTVINPKGEAR